MDFVFSELVLTLYYPQRIVVVCTVASSERFADGFNSPSKKWQIMLDFIRTASLEWSVGELSITEPVARLVQLIAVGAKTQGKKEAFMKKRKSRIQQFMDKYQISERAAKAWLSTIGKANSRARWRK